VWSRYWHTRFSVCERVWKRCETVVTVYVCSVCNLPL
jgi:hypothetical protein